MKPTNWKTGLKRIYFTIAALWYCMAGTISIKEMLYGGWGMPETILSIAFIAAPFIIYYVAIWIWQGFHEKTLSS